LLNQTRKPTLRQIQAALGGTVCSCTGFIFFSSRRRHTRSDRDWSSDVCSSDLSFSVPGTVAFRSRALGWSTCWRLNASSWRVRRSEERRVGKEWRAGLRPDGFKEEEGDPTVGQARVVYRSGSDAADTPRGRSLC